MPRDYRNIRGRAFESDAMPSIKNGLQWKGPSESDLNLGFMKPKCMYCGGEMAIWRETENQIQWRCFGIDESNNKPCINNPDYELKDPLTYDQIEHTGNRLKRFADWMPPRLI